MHACDPRQVNSKPVKWLLYIYSQMLCTHLCTSMCFVATSWSQIPPILDWHWANHMTALVPVKIPPTNRIKKLIVSHEPMENIYHNCNQIIRTQPWKYFMPYMWGFFQLLLPYSFTITAIYPKVYNKHKLIRYAYLWIPLGAFSFWRITSWDW